MRLPLGLGCIYSSMALGIRAFTLRFAWEHPVWMTGITNRVRDRSGELIGYALFADIDGGTLEQLKAKLEQANRIFPFGDVFIIRSSFRGWHLIAPKICDDRQQALFSYLIGSDHDLALFRKHKEMTLRFSAKNGEIPRYIGKWHGAGNGVASAGHLWALRNIYKVPKRELKYPAAGEWKPQPVNYETLNW